MSSLLTERSVCLMYLWLSFSFFTISTNLSCNTSNSFFILLLYYLTNSLFRWSWWELNPRGYHSWTTVPLTCQPLCFIFLFWRTFMSIWHSTSFFWFKALRKLWTVSSEGYRLLPHVLLKHISSIQIGKTKIGFVLWLPNHIRELTQCPSSVTPSSVVYTCWQSARNDENGSHNCLTVNVCL